MEPSAFVFVFLEHLVVDVENMTAFRRNCPVGAMYKVERTANYDRRRSRLTDRKTFDLSTAFQSAKSSFFAKHDGEFAWMWQCECNGGWGNKPSAQQVLVGLWEFYSSLLDAKANGGERARLFDTLTTY